MNAPLACLNGEIVPLQDARVPIGSRAARFGDGVFETIALENGVPHQWERHIARLGEGLAVLRIPAPDADLKSAARSLIQRQKACDGFLRISISRGGESAGYMPLSPHTAPDWWMEILPHRPAPTHAATLLLSHIRKPSAHTLPMAHKLAQGVNSTLALLEAQEHGAEEALMLSESEFVCSAAASNIFWVKNDCLFTPALSTNCLNGITRQTLLRIMPDTHEVHAPLSELARAECVFLTNTRVGIWPAASLIHHTVSWQANHPLVTELKLKLIKEKLDYLNNNSAYWKNYS